MNPTEYRDAMIAELRQHGVTKHRVEHGGKHPKLYFRWQGRERSIILPGSPSDRKGILAGLTQLRRLLGVKKATTKRVSTKPKRVKVGKAEQRPDLLKLAEARPFAALEAIQAPVDAPQLGFGPHAPITNSERVFAEEPFSVYAPASPPPCILGMCGPLPDPETTPRPWWRRALDRFVALFVERKPGLWS